MQLNDKVYQTMKWIAQVFLPGFIAFYLSVSDAWGFTHVREVSLTLAALNTFMGLVLGLSSAAYKSTVVNNAGWVQQVGSDPDTGLPHMEVTFNGTELGGLAGKKMATFMVSPPPPPTPQD